MFGVYASVQFLRSKSVKLLLVASSPWAVMINVIALIALPIYKANETSEVTKPAETTESPESGCDHPAGHGAASITQKITLGIVLLLVYRRACLSYLTSPPVRRHFQTALKPIRSAVSGCRAVEGTAP